MIIGIDFDGTCVTHEYPNSFKKAFFKSKNKQQTAMIMGLERREKAKRLLYKLLYKNLEGWWD